MNKKMFKGSKGTDKLKEEQRIRNILENEEEEWYRKRAEYKKKNPDAFFVPY